MFTYDEMTTVLEGLTQLRVSAQRMQNTKRGTPQIKEVYASHEKYLLQLEAKAVKIADELKLAQAAPAVARR